MLLSREEMTFDFGGARFDPAADRKVLGFILSQFLYGEVTGIQCGLWLHRAPDLEAATFFARQAQEEFAHVRIFSKMLATLGESPQPAHPLVRLLAAPADTFAEHVLLEMAMGEGFVLMVFYALIDTLGAPDLVRMLDSAVKQEERHVAFGETRTRAVLATASPGLRRRLLAQAVLSVIVLERLVGKLAKLAPEHPVMRQLPAFAKKTIACTEERLRRIALLEGTLADFGAFGRARLAALAIAVRLGRKLWPRREKLLTETYLGDAAVLAAKAPPEAGAA